MFASLSRSVQLKSACKFGVLLISLCFLIAVIWWYRATFHASKRYNVILFSIDSLRSDHMHLYGYGRPTTPNIDEWSKQAIVFTNYFATSYLTPVSEASVHSGLHPEANGLISFTTSFSNNIKTMAEILKTSGYRTIAFGNSPEYQSFTAIRDSFSRGFDYYLIKRWRIGNPPRVLDWNLLESTIEQTGDQPFFIWIALGDVHAPFGYTIKNNFADEAYNGPMRYLVHGSNNQFVYDGWIYNPFLPSADFAIYRPDRDDLDTGDRAFAPLRLQKKWPIEVKNEDLEFVRANYDNGIVKADEEFARLRNLLEKIGHSKDTVIILQSEHGETIGEHGYIAHYDIWDEAIHVPLIISSPAIKSASRSDVLVSGVDILPTILSHTGVPPPSYGLQGHAILKRGFFAMVAQGREEVFSTRTPLWESFLKVRKRKTIFDDFRQLDRTIHFKDYAIRTKEKKLIHRKARFAEEQYSCWTYVLGKKIVRPEFEYYDLLADPLEQKPLAADSEEAKNLQNKLMEFEREQEANSRVGKSRPEIQDYQ